MRKSLGSQNTWRAALSLVWLIGNGFLAAAHGAAEEPARVYTAADVKISGAQRKAAETFYKGKTIEWISYTNPGAGTETMLRVMMKYLPKYIPGNPRMGSVQFMRGGGGLLSSNYLYNRAPRDGTMLGQISAGTHRSYIAGRKGVEYDLNKFTWIANYLPRNYHYLVYTRRGIGLDSIEQLIKAPKVNMGVTEVGHAFYIAMRMGMHLLGIKFNIIPGYSDKEIDLAFERGEVDGKVDAALSFMTERKHLLEQNKAVIHWTTEPSRFPQFPNVPSIFELARQYANPPLTPRDQALLQVNWDIGAYGRYLAMPPGVPAERALAVQEAVGKMIDDKEFYGEFAKLSGFEPEFTPGDVLIRTFRSLSDQPKEVLDFWLKLSGPEPLPPR
jgi:tripartite-type tricarboxylate transporter receptor subunit TctC